MTDLVSYLTPVSDLHLAPDTDQIVASPAVRYKISYQFFSSTNL